MKILSVEQINEVDRLSSEECSVPGLILMENAGFHLFSALWERFGEGLASRRILILCGKGNNGGDGFVLARQLAQRGILPEVCLFGRSGDVSGDAAVNLSIWRAWGGPIREVLGEADWDPVGERLDGFDVVVDALLGTGLKTPLRGLYLKAVEAVNRRRAFVLSVDIPSGMFSDSTRRGAPTVKADLTVTFTAPKIAHALNEDQEAIGVLKVVPIGSPPRLLENPAYFLSQIEAVEVARSLPPRRTAHHKGDCGHVAVVAGSRGKAGAAALSSFAALRAGSGLVTAFTPAPVQDLVAGFHPEVMTEGLDATGRGTFAAGALEPLLAGLEGKDAAALGPGLGLPDETASVVRELARRAGLPLVLDADALNALQGRPEILAERASEILVLTPHPGEFSRLTGIPTDEILSNNVALARDFARRHGVWLVLKGFRTLVAEPEGRVFACARGNPGMASAGMGDVLTGVLVSLLGLFAAQGRRSPAETTQAVTAAVHLHALAGDLAAERVGREALTAGDVTESLGEAFRQVRHREP